ncbi:MAG: alpha/beta fold hydrolase [Bacteroidales bacterium]|nr:alpha/beta fold hydrolase [Bacteroidales bacterium]
MNPNKITNRINNLFLPKIAAKKTNQFMSTPKEVKFRRIETDTLEKAQKQLVRFKNFDLQTYIWGENTEKRVFVIHGWEGHSGNFAPIIEVLLKKDCQVIAFDAPSHGNSTKGKTTMFEFGEFISLMLQKYKPQIIISHSFGNVNTAMALKENQSVKIKQWFMVASPHDFRNRINSISEIIGLSKKAKKYFTVLVAKDAKEKVENLNMNFYSKELKNVEKYYFIHPKNDEIISVEAAYRNKEVLPEAKFVEFEKFGHMSILWSGNFRQFISSELK